LVSTIVRVLSLRYPGATGNCYNPEILTIIREVCRHCGGDVSTGDDKPFVRPVHEGATGVVQCGEVPPVGLVGSGVQLQVRLGRVQLKLKMFIIEYIEGG